MNNLENCPQCGDVLKMAVYGFVTFNGPTENVVFKGCSIPEDREIFNCVTCGYRAFESGKVENPARDRALGSIIGLAVGDALGEPYEFKPPVTEDTPITMEYNDNWHPGQWTDDTAMAIGIMQAWVIHGTIRTVQAQDELVAIWRKWCESAVDAGAQTRAVLYSLDDLSAARAFEASYEHHVSTGRSGGNGSLMRTAPLAFLNATDEQVALAVTQISKLTHYDDDAAHACIIWVFAIRHAIKTGKLSFESGFDFIPDDAKAKWQGFLQEAKENPPVHFENNGWVVAAFKAAASAVMIGEYDFVPGIEAAVRAGYDTDTVAAIAGSLLGALHGTSGIPEHWIEPLHGWPDFSYQKLAMLTKSTLDI